MIVLIIRKKGLKAKRIFVYNIRKGWWHDCTRANSPIKKGTRMDRIPIIIEIRHCTNHDFFLVPKKYYTIRCIPATHLWCIRHYHVSIFCMESKCCNGSHAAAAPIATAMEHTNTKSAGIAARIFANNIITLCRYSTRKIKVQKLLYRYPRWLLLWHVFVRGSKNTWQTRKIVVK